MDISPFSAIDIKSINYLGNTKKLEYFLLDLHFREAFEDIRAVFTTEQISLMLSQYTPVIFKPESFASRKIEKALAILAESGFTPLLGKLIRFNPTMVRNVWQYQFNAANRGRIDLVTMTMTAADSLYVLFRYTKPLEDNANAIAILANFKGGSKQDEQSPQTLRYKLGWVNEIMNYSHVPDEPADFVRELGIFFDYRQRQEILQSMLADQVDQADQKEICTLIHQQCQKIPQHDLNFVKSVQRIKQVCQAISTDSARSSTITIALQQILRDCACLELNQKIDWRCFWKNCDAVADINPWDLYTVLTTHAYLPPLPGVRPVF